MARIPVVQEPSIRPEGLPTPYARPIATPQGDGAGFGEILQQGAAVAAQYAQEARRKGDAASIQGAWGAGQDLLNKQILDPEKGYSALRGKDAMDARDKVLGDYDKGLEKINAGLTPEQQTMFAPHLRVLKEQGFTHSVSHESQEMERYSQAQFKGNIDSTMETMQMPQVLASANDPDPEKDDLKKQVGKLYQASIDEAKRKYGTGASKEAIASVVDPALQTAALGGMQAALQQAEAAGDPSIASNAFGVLGKYLLKGHQKQIGGMVEALSAKAAIRAGAQAVIGAATDSVILPDGGQVARVDGGKVAGGVADLKDDTPHLSEIQDAIEKKQARLNKVWDGATGTVYQRVEGAAMLGGGFDLDRAKATDKEWLRVNAPDLLRKLQKEDDRGSTTERSLESKEAWSSLAADMAAHPDIYKEKSASEFTKLSVEMGVGPLDRIKALKLHQDLQKAGQSEKVNKTVSEQLVVAFPGTNNAKKRAALQGMLLDAASDYADRWKADTEGKVVPTEKLRQFIDAELVKGKVQGTGILFDDAATRLEYQKNPKYQGKSFVPSDAAAPLIPQTPPNTPAVNAATPGAAPRQPPMPGAVHIVKGTQSGWLLPGKTMPAGWKAD